MFQLETTTPAKLTSVNVRSELHGKEHVPAVDLRLSFDASNGILSQFDGWLLTALYHRAKPADPAKDAQGTLDGVEEVSDVPDLRMPLLTPPIKWSKEYSGYELTLDYGMGGKSNVVLVDCEVNSIAFEPKQGGTVTTTMRVQCSKGLTEKMLGKLATLVQHDVAILLTPPEAEPTLPATTGEASKAALDASGNNPFGGGKTDDEVRAEALANGTPAGRARKAAGAEVE